MLLGAKQFFMQDSKLKQIDGIMISGRWFSTGISGSDASHSLEVEADVIMFDIKAGGEFDFLGNFDGNRVSRALMMGLFGTSAYISAYIYVAGANRATSLGSLPIGVPVRYRAYIDYDSGAFNVGINDSSVSGTVSLDEFSLGTYPFYIGAGNNYGYAACPAVIKEVKFTLDNVLVADYVPAYEGGRIGLRDIVRDTFNADTAGFALPYIASIQ